VFEILRIKLLYLIEILRRPQNMIAQSQSGTGKTAAFVLAMLSRVDTSKNYPQVLCLSPTYELALQTGEVIKQMAKFCPEITVQFAVRGVDGKFTSYSLIVLVKPCCILSYKFTAHTHLHYMYVYLKQFCLL
jgi:superfamily II DNA/RNA helicase